MLFHLQLLPVRRPPSIRSWLLSVLWLRLVVPAASAAEVVVVGRVVAVAAAAVVVNLSPANAELLKMGKSLRLSAVLGVMHCFSTLYCISLKPDLNYSL